MGRTLGCFELRATHLILVDDDDLRLLSLRFKIEGERKKHIINIKLIQRFLHSKLAENWGKMKEVTDL